MNFKIQSFSGVITNSSTEVFMRFDRSNIASIKELVNTLLAAGESNFTFDDLFIFKFAIDDWTIESILDEGPDNYPYLKGLKTIEEIREKIDSLSMHELFDLQEAYEGNDYDSYRLIYGLNIIPKVQGTLTDKAAAVLSNITNIFDLDYSYN